jgi:hypothetical protein
MKRCSDGYSWVMLINTSNNQGHDFTYEIDETMSEFINRVEDWPKHDLFEYDTPRPLFTYTKSNG